MKMTDEQREQRITALTEEIVKDMMHPFFSEQSIPAVSKKYKTLRGLIKGRSKTQIIKMERERGLA